MQESVIERDILQKGEQRETFKYTLRLVNHRFGYTDSAFTERTLILSANQLENLGEALFDFSDVSNCDLVNWLNQHENS